MSAIANRLAKLEVRIFGDTDQRYLDNMMAMENDLPLPWPNMAPSPVVEQFFRAYCKAPEREQRQIFDELKADVA